MKSPDLAIYVFCLYGEESNKIATFIWVVEIYASGSVANFRFCKATKRSLSSEKLELNLKLVTLIYVVF